MKLVEVKLPVVTVASAGAEALRPDAARRGNSAAARDAPAYVQISAGQYTRAGVTLHNLLQPKLKSPKTK